MWCDAMQCNVMWRNEMQCDVMQCNVQNIHMEWYKWHRPAIREPRSVLARARVHQCVAGDLCAVNLWHRPSTLISNPLAKHRKNGSVNQKLFLQACASNGHISSISFFFCRCKNCVLGLLLMSMIWGFLRWAFSILAQAHFVLRL